MSEPEKLDFSDITLDAEGAEPAPEAAPERAPEPEAEPEKKPVEFDEAQQAHLNEIVGKKAAQKAEEARLRAEAERRAEEAEAKLAQLSQPGRPEVPPMPDEYEDNFLEKYKAREQAIIAQVRYDEAEALRQRQKDDARQAEIRAKQEEVNSTISGYMEKAQKLGIDTVTIQQESGLLANYVQDESLLAHILSDDQGPLIGSYIVNNPLEADLIARSTPLQAAAYIESTIKPKAVASRKKATPDPKPLDNPEGTSLGEPNEDDKWGTYS